VFRRILTEKRAFVLPLVIILLANLAAYAFVVYPLRIQVSSAGQRATAADQNRRAAERDFAAARATATGKDRVEAELKKFYGDVLPADVSRASRITYLRLSQLARDANLKIERRTTDEERIKDSMLGRLKISMTLTGSYEDVRRFVYKLETAPEFVVIENVAIEQGRESNASLAVTLELSTYYRAAANAS
jgi:Tfp pilus assembly protein PilO